MNIPNKRFATEKIPNVIIQLTRPNVSKNKGKTDPSTKQMIQTNAIAVAMHVARIFFGNISTIRINGIGINPIQLKKTMHVNKTVGIHSYSGCNNKQYIANKKKLIVVSIDEPI